VVSKSDGSTTKGEQVENHPSAQGRQEHDHQEAGPDRCHHEYKQLEQPGTKALGLQWEGGDKFGGARPEERSREQEQARGVGVSIYARMAQVEHRFA
jgi:hypothetical protein